MIRITLICIALVACFALSGVTIAASTVFFVGHFYFPALLMTAFYCSSMSLVGGFWDILRWSWQDYRRESRGNA